MSDESFKDKFNKLLKKSDSDTREKMMDSYFLGYDNGMNRILKEFGIQTLKEDGSKMTFKEVDDAVENILKEMYNEEDSLIVFDEELYVDDIEKERYDLISKSIIYNSSVCDELLKLPYIKCIYTGYDEINNIASVELLINNGEDDIKGDYAFSDEEFSNSHIGITIILKALLNEDLGEFENLERLK